MPDELIKTDELARRLGVAPTTIRRWVAEGRIQAIRLVGGQRMRFDWDAVLRSIRTRDMESRVTPDDRA